MRRGSILSLLLLLTLSTAACRSFAVEISLNQPAELTATVQARQAWPTPMPRLQPFQLAYVQGGDLWIQDLPNGQPRRLTQDGCNDSPLWSPSGDWLAFRKEQPTGHYTLWLIRTSGAAAHSLGLGAQVAWSPVADQLAYISQDALLLTAADGEPRQLVPSMGGSEGSNRLGALAWSPDGQWIAFDKLAYSPDGKPAAQGIWRIHADSGQLNEVYLNPDPATAQSYLAGWSPDGYSLLFWQRQVESSAALSDGLPLMRVHIGGGRPVEVAKQVLMYRDLLAWSPDGQHLAVVDGPGRETWANKAIRIANPMGQTQPLSDDSLAGLHPAWSPDGRWLAFTAGPAAAQGPGQPLMAQRRIWLVAADGADRRPLTDDPTFRDERPCWSPDGAYLLFARLQGEQAQLWMMHHDGSEMQRMVGELTPSPGTFGYYGYIDWQQLYDCWPHNSRPPIRPTPTPAPTATAEPTPTLAPTITLTADAQEAIGVTFRFLSKQPTVAKRSLFAPAPTTGAGAARPGAAPGARPGPGRRGLA